MRTRVHYLLGLLFVCALSASAATLDGMKIHSAVVGNGPKTVILSYNLWHNILGADPNILGHAVVLKGEPYNVIGILPEGAITPSNADLYTALQPSRQGEGGGTNFEAITRLRDGKPEKL